MKYIALALFSTMTVKTMDNLSKLTTSYITLHQDAEATKAFADLGAVCVFCAIGLAATLLAIAFGDVSGLAAALAMTG
jgi:hypothetical protein